MARPAAATIDRVTPRRRRLFGFEFAEIPDQHVPVLDVTRGMVTAIQRQEAGTGAAQSIKNGRVRDSWVGRRPGTAEFIAKPDSNTVRKVVTFFNSAGDRVIVRIAVGALEVAYTNDEWVTLSLNGLNLNDSRYTTTQFLDNLVVADGVDKLRYLPHNGTQLEEIEDSYIARYVTNFGDRIVAAYLGKQVGGWFPTGIAWCSPNDPFEWDALDENDEITGAGEENLANTVTDLGDPITGLIPLSNFLVVLRERSITLGSRNPIAANPFRFQNANAGTGCDLPYTAVRAFQDAVIFADWTTNSVYVYTPGARPQKISDDIDDELFQGLASRFWCEAAWDDENREYHLGITTTEGSKLIQKVWVWNADNQAWSFDDLELSCLSAVAVPFSDTSIDELAGTIDAQTESIDDLGTQTENPIRLMAGTAAGEVIEYDYANDTDYNGSEFEFIWESIDHGPPGQRGTLKRVMAIVENQGIAGSVSFESSDDGVTWENTKITTLLAGVGWKKLGSFLQQTGDHLHWRMVATSTGVRMREFWMRILVKFEHEL